MYTITQVNDVPTELAADQLIAAAHAGGCIQAYKFRQANGMFTVIVVRQ